MLDGKGQAMKRGEWVAHKVARLKGLNYASLRILRSGIEVSKQLEESADISHVYG